MINYDHLRDNDDFMRVLSAIREHCLAGEEEIAEREDMDYGVVREHYHMAQAIVAEEIDHGIVHDPYGASVAQGFMTWLRTEYPQGAWGQKEE